MGYPISNRRMVRSSSATKRLKRRHLAENLEPRMLLAGDVGSIDHIDSPAAALIATTSAEGEAGSLGDLNSFAQQLRAAVDEIARVIGSIGQSSVFGQEIPFLGQSLPVDVGDLSVIDTDTVGSLLNLSSSFETDVASPLRSFLDANPQATPNQLITQFDFLEQLDGQTGTIPGVKLNFDLSKTLQRPIESLLRPLTELGGPFQVPTGAALSQLLSFDISTEDLKFQIFVDDDDQVRVEIPNFSVNIGNADLGISNLAGRIGVLAGNIFNPEFDLDLGWNFDAGTLFGGGLNSPDTPTLASLQSTTANSIIDNFVATQVGEGLSLQLPFDFALPGFDTGGVLPTLSLVDDSPLDEVLGRFEILLPENAPYDLESLLAFTEITPSELLGYLGDLGDLLQQIQNGSVLDLPIPFADDITVGEALGLAEGYANGVMHFLRTGEGLPTFDSLQELIALLPGLPDPIEMGPQPPMTTLPFSYDPETKLLDISLNFFRSPDPINLVGSLDVFAGNEDAPFVSIAMDQTDPDTGEPNATLNRVAITRDASLGLDLQIDLSLGKYEKTTREFKAFDHSLNYAVTRWTRLDEFAQRFGFGDELGLQAIADVTLRDGTPAILNFGTLDPSMTVGDLLDRGQIIGSNVFDQPGEPFSAAMFYTKLESDQLQLLDRSADTGDFTVVPRRTPETAHAFWDNLFGDNDVSFNEFVGTSGFMGSRLLRGSLLDGHLSPTGNGDSETPLRWLFPAASEWINLLDGIQPVTAHLQDGQEVTIEFTDFDQETIESLLPTLAAEIGGTQVIDAVIEDERIVLTDLTSGSNKFRIEWADAPGLPILGQLIDIGNDSDRDGKLIGPRLLPALTNDLRVAISRETLMIDLAAQYGIDPTLPDGFTLHPKDGSEVSISAASYAETETLGEFIDLFNDGLTDQGMNLVDGQLIFYDDSSGPSGSITFLEVTAGGLFSKLFPEINRVDGDKDGIVRSRVLTTTGIAHDTLVTDLLPAGVDLRNTGEVRVDLLDGTSLTLPSLSLSDGGTIRSVIDDWSVIRDNQRILAAGLIGGRIVLRDLTQAANGNTFRIRVSGDATVEGTLLFDARDDDGNGQIEGRELGNPLPAVIDAPLQIAVDAPVAPWTQINTLGKRFDTNAFSDGLEQIRFELRDGTIVKFVTSNEDGSTLADLLDQKQYRDDGTLVAELTLEDNRLVLNDYSGGTGTIQQTADFQFGVLLQTLFDNGQIDDSGDRWISGPLDETVFDEAGNNVSLRRFFDDPFHPLFGSPTSPTFASELIFSLRDGTVHETGLMSPTSLTLRRYLDQLTVRDGNVVLVQPSVIDGRIVLADQTAGNGVFTVEAKFPTTATLHHRFLTLGSDINDDGELIGPSLIASLPSGIDPIRDTIQLETILEASVGGTVAAQSLTTTASATIEFRDGSVETILIEPLPENATLGDLINQLRIVDGDETVFEVELVDGRLIASQSDSRDGSGDFRINDTDLATNRLLTALGLTSGNTSVNNNPLAADPDGDGTIEGASLYRTLDVGFLEIGGLDLGDISTPNSSMTLYLRDGTQEIVSVGALTETDELLEVIARLNVPDKVQVTYSNGRVVVEDLTTPIDDRQFSIDFGNTSNTYPTSAFLPLATDLDGDGRIAGPSLIRTVPTSATSPEILLDELATRFSLPAVNDVEDVVVEITLRNGLQVTQQLKVQPGMTLRKFLSQMNIVEQTPDGPNVLFLADVIDINGTATSNQAPRYRVVLRDFSESVDGNGETQVRRLVDQEDFGSMLPTFLGIYGRDTTNTGVIVGNSMELVDDSERVRIKLTEPPTLSAAINVDATNVTATAALGALASAGIRNGSGSAYASVDVSVLPSIGKDYITIKDLIGAVTGRNDRLQVELDTNLAFGAELFVDLGGLNEQFTDPAETPRIDVAWPEFVTNDPSLQFQFDTLDYSFTNAENLLQLKKLTLQDITNLIRKVVDLVERVAGEDLLYKQLPLVNTSIGDVLNAVDYVDSIVQNTLEDPDASLKTLEAQLEDALGLDDDELTLSYDADNNAVRIDLDLQVGTAQRPLVPLWISIWPAPDWLDWMLWSISKQAVAWMSLPTQICRSMWASTWTRWAFIAKTNSLTQAIRIRNQQQTSTTWSSFTTVLGSRQPCVFRPRICNSRLRSDHCRWMSGQARLSWTRTVWRLAAKQEPPIRPRCRSVCQPNPTAFIGWTNWFRFNQHSLAKRVCVCR